MNKSVARLVVALVLACAALAVSPAHPAFAATAVWSGLYPTDSNMTSGDNWVGGVAPSEGDALVFPSDASVTMINDYPEATRFASMSFPFTGSGTFSQMFGSGMTLNEGISVDGYQVLLLTPVVFEGSQSVIASGAAANLYGASTVSERIGPFAPPVLTLAARSAGRVIVNAPISGVGGLRVLTDAGADVLIGGAGSWEGTTTVGDGAEPGVLTIASTGALAAPPVVIAAGSGLVADYKDAGGDDTWPNEISGGTDASVQVKSGSALHLTHDNSSTFNGTAVVDSGSLELAPGAALGGAVHGNYGALSGTGTFPSVLMTSPVLMPGAYAPNTLAPTQSSIGTMTVSGDLAMTGTQKRLQIKVANAGDATTGVGARVDAVEVTGSADFGASSSQIVLKSLVDGPALRSFGSAASFNPAKSYSWPVLHASGGISCPGGFTVDSTGWSNARNGGTFGTALSADAKTLYVTFTPAIRRVAFVAAAHGSLEGSTTQLISEGGNATGVTAIPDTGYHFVNWYRSSGSGGSFVSTANPVVLTGAAGDTTLTAAFAVDTFKIAPTAGPGGSISPATTQTVNYGASSATFTITPSTGYRIADVSVDGSSQGAQSTYRFTNVTRDHTIAATFVRETPTLRFVAGANGSVEGLTTQVVEYGSSSTAVTATPAAHYHFVNWTGTGGFTPSTDNPLTITNATTDQTVTANFAIDTLAVSYHAGAGGSISGAASQTVDYGGSGTTVTATPDAGQRFVAWSDGYPTAERRDTGVTGTVDATATFAPSTHTVRFVTDGSPGATVSTATVVVDDGSPAGPVTATAGPGYDFVDWTGSGFATSTSNPLTVAGVTSDLTITANFAVTPVVPVTTISSTPADWSSQDVTFTLTATGTAPVSSFYGLNAPATTAYTGEVSVTAEGTTTIAYRSANVAGSEDTKTATVRIDKTAPVTTSSVEPTYTGPAVITLEASDPYSGVAATYYSINGEPFESYSGSIEVTIAGPDALDFYSVDVAGNREPTRTVHFAVVAQETETGGTTRYETNVVGSRSTFETDSVATVVIATGQDFPDALAAAPLAGACRSPVLLTQASSVPAATLAEIERLGATRAIVIGGPGVVTPAAVSQVAAAVGGASRVERIYGADRYATAAAVTAKILSVHPAIDHTFFLATGTDYPDAMAAGADAWATVRPILLTNGATVPAATLNAVSSLSATRVVVLGGTGVVPEPAVTAVKARMLAPKASVRLAGTNRYETACAVAEWAGDNEGLSWTTVGVATGANYPDALGAGPVSAARSGNVLLVEPTRLPDATAAILDEHKATVMDAMLFGGDGAISASVRAEVMQVLR
jgi:uncharacterized repeat protein (TIGR02543 family)